MAMPATPEPTELEVLRALLRTDGEGLEPRGSAGRLTVEDLKSHGLSKREAIELLSKLEPTERPDFELDLAAMKSPEEFESRMREAVPGDFE